MDVVKFFSQQLLEKRGTNPSLERSVDNRMQNTEIDARAEVHAAPIL